jgi:hypothetical protein
VVLAAVIEVEFEAIVGAADAGDADDEVVRGVGVGLLQFGIAVDVDYAGEAAGPQPLVQRRFAPVGLTIGRPLFMARIRLSLSAGMGSPLSLLVIPFSASGPR